MNHSDVIIIGSGPAGLTAALYCARAQLQPLVFEGTLPGGQLMKTTYVDNWPGALHIKASQLMLDIKAQVKSFGVTFISETIERVDFSHHPFTLSTRKSSYQAHAVIIATGATPKKLECPGESEYWGKGISTCAICDGALYADKRVLVVGGGDTAIENALFMTNFTSHITVVHILDSFTASSSMQQRLAQIPSIDIKFHTTVTAIDGNDTHVTTVTLTDQKTKATQNVAVDAVFLAIGIRPNSELFKNQLELDSMGHVIQKQHTHTSIPGIFVAGDVADSRYRQAITAAGSGCMAALDAEKFLHGLTKKT
jgi:thioredoxin reductase (NADPH)